MWSRLCHLHEHIIGHILLDDDHTYVILTKDVCFEHDYFFGGKSLNLPSKTFNVTE